MTCADDRPDGLEASAHVLDEGELHQRLGEIVTAFAIADDWMTQNLAVLVVYDGEGDDMSEVHARLISDHRLWTLTARAEAVQRRMDSRQGTNREVPQDIQARFQDWSSKMSEVQERRNRIIHDSWTYVDEPQPFRQIRPPRRAVPAAIEWDAERDEFDALRERSADLGRAFHKAIRALGRPPSPHVRPR